MVRALSEGKWNRLGEGQWRSSQINSTVGARIGEEGSCGFQKSS